VGNEEAWPLTPEAKVIPDASVYIPVPPPTIAGITVQPDGQVRIQASGWPGVTFALEASVDLGEWQPIGSTVAAADGSLEFTDPAPAPLAQRFYRLRGP